MTLSNDRSLVSVAVNALHDQQWKTAIRTITEQAKLITAQAAGHSFTGLDIPMPDKVRAFITITTLSLGPIANWKLPEIDSAKHRRAFNQTQQLLAGLEETGWAGDSHDRWDSRTDAAMRMIFKWLKSL